MHVQTLLRTKTLAHIGHQEYLKSTRLFSPILYCCDVFQLNAGAIAIDKASEMLLSDVTYRSFEVCLDG